MTEDFALIDFALVDCPPGEVAEALGRAYLNRARRKATEGRPAAAGGGFLSRLFRRGETETAEREARAALRVQPSGTVSGPITRAHLAETRDTGFDSAVRLTAPVGAAGMTLIEFREGDCELSAVMEALSAALAGCEIFFFRHSGSTHPGAHFAFHVYLDGRCTRRAVSVSANGTSPEADWTGADAGMPHPLETDSLPAPGIPRSEIMTPVRQASILESMGIDPDTLFDALDPAAVVLELSSAPGGQPVDDASGIVAHRRRTPPELKPVAGTERPASASVRPPRPAPPKPDAAAMPWEAQVPAPSWEEEVTALLVAAVESALPAEEQVGWLEDLTRQLESGEIDAALAEARRVIAAGNRPQAEKDAATRRLAELFGKAI